MQDKDTLAAEIARMETAGLTGGDVLELNVGGKQLSTSRETLTQVEPLLQLGFSAT